MKNSINSEDVLLTVAICTHNRGELLQPLIDKLLSQREKSCFNILVVDNSTSAEAKSVAEIISKKPNVRVIYSNPPGLSIARNFAIENCETEYIAYLDDDAMPLDGWSSSICTPFEDASVGFVAGPIIPVWPEEGRPDWIPEQFVGCLTVLDLGISDRKLDDYEHAYGANMAFRVKALKDIGGFNAMLGRSGTNSLLSNEEVEVQEKLRKSGFVGYYASQASVHHLVEPERLTRHWFLSRMAWQGVSVAFKAEHLNQDAMLYELNHAANRCGSGNFPALLLNETEPELFGERLRFVGSLFAYLLSAKSMKDLPKEVFKQQDIVSKPIQQQSDHEKLMQDYQSCAATPAGTRTVFFDSYSGHHYLYDLYGNIPNSHFVVAEMNQWEDQGGRDMRYLERSINSGVDSIVLLTLDPYVYGPNFSYFYDMLKRQSPNKKIFGILHKLPEVAKQIERLTRVAPFINMIVLDESLRDIVHEVTRSKNVFSLPHHAVFERFLVAQKDAKARCDIKKDKIVISLLGEIRDGKGINRLIDALQYLSAKVKSEVLFLIVGNAKCIEPDELRADFLTEGVTARVISERVENGYKLVPDSELADYISSSDIGLLLFEKSQKVCMSGILPNYVMQGVPIIASEDSIVGRFVSANKLGWVTDISYSEGLANVITQAVKQSLDKSMPVNEKIKKQLHSTSVLQRLEDILKEKKD